MEPARTVLATTAIILGLMVITSSCKNNQATSALPAHHIILAFDGVGNTKVDRWVWSSDEFYQEFIDYLEHAGGGVLQLYSFTDSIPDPISLHIKSMYTLPSVYEGESRIQPVKNLNDSIRLLNHRYKSTFWKLLKTKIPNFDPDYEHHFAYAEANLEAMLESLNSPLYHSQQSSMLLYSDLINCLPSSPAEAVKEELVLQIIQTNARIALCSYAQNHATDLVQSSQILSPQDFLEFLMSPK